MNKFNKAARGSRLDGRKAKRRRGAPGAPAVAGPRSGKARRHLERAKRKFCDLTSADHHARAGAQVQREAAVSGGLMTVKDVEMMAAKVQDKNGVAAEQTSNAADKKLKGVKLGKKARLRLIKKRLVLQGAQDLNSQPINTLHAGTEAMVE
eukprot:SM000025S08431  [mRNA]  locus=s25:756435:757615:+ [translate_table: standard]